jgi:hypothetical protein
MVLAENKNQGGKIEKNNPGKGKILTKYFFITFLV